MELTAYTALVPIVIGLIQVIKMSLPKESKARNLVPISTIVLAIALSLLAYGATGAVVLNGIATGLAAIGLFSGTRSSVEGVKSIVSK